MCRLAALLGLAAAGLACGPPPAVPDDGASPGERHRRVLLRPGGMFVQIRLDRVRTRLPSLAEIVTFAWTPSLPGAACLVDLVWSADVASAFFATPSSLGPPTSGAAIVEGSALPDDRVPAWADCVLGGLGSGSRTRLVAPPPGEAGEPIETPPVAFVAGTGTWESLGIAPLQPGRWTIVAGEPFDTWAREIAGLQPPPRAADAPFADEIAGADVQLAWLDATALADLLERGSMGLGPVPPARELRGAALGLWLGDAPRMLGVVQARGPESARAVVDTLSTVTTVMRLAVSVEAAQLGRVYGDDIQERVEQVAAIAERAAIEQDGARALVRLDLTAEDLDRIQGFALELASRMLAD